MRRALSVAGLVTIASIARGDAPQLPPPVINALTQIDTVPSEPELTPLWGQPLPASQQLAQLASDPTHMLTEKYFGIRLRAIHGLAKYCPLPGQSGTPVCDPSDPGWPAHEALVALVQNQPLQVHAGADLLVIRAAVESLGQLHVAADVAVLSPLLEHSSRDIRAATARALRDLCNSAAETPLRTRQAHESSQQVSLAITDALRVLQTCP